MKFYYFRFQLRKWKVTEGRMTDLSGAQRFWTIGRDWHEASERARAFFDCPIEITDTEERVELFGTYGVEPFDAPRPVQAEEKKRTIQVD